MKLCKDCKTMKPLDEMTKAKDCKDGHSNQCKKCKNKQAYELQQRQSPGSKNYVLKERNPELLKLRKTRIEELRAYYEKIAMYHQNLPARQVDKMYQIKK